MHNLQFQFRKSLQIVEDSVNGEGVQRYCKLNQTSVKYWGTVLLGFIFLAKHFTQPLFYVYSFATDPAAVRVRTKTSVSMFNRYCGLAIECESDGNPRPEVKLQKKSSDKHWKTLPNETSVMSKVWRKVTFRLYDKCREITGAYRCFASNNIGTILFTDSVEVVCK